ncbi:hypothetical protein [Sphingomonas corticis]|jgi:hypothetical protein|uniref:UrcA family protein n=1 Tax=Sphingomonas corticis TaxID=2722791 RepID=A0ABX1CT51_9SPHN|nr:hypothetical protein [Sphingomonas corticis]NJR79818.1 hypothetical protein [Sphingomonas corticis]
MMKLSAAIILAGLPLAPVYGQMDPTLQAQGTLLMGQNQGYIDRANARKTRSASSRASVKRDCTKYLPIYRQQYGSDHPQVVKLQGLCRRAGF